MEKALETVAWKIDEALYERRFSCCFKWTWKDGKDNQAFIYYSTRQFHTWSSSSERTEAIVS